MTELSKEELQEAQSKLDNVTPTTIGTVEIDIVLYRKLIFTIEARDLEIKLKAEFIMQLEKDNYNHEANLDHVTELLQESKTVIAETIDDLKQMVYHEIMSKRGRKSLYIIIDNLSLIGKENNHHD